VRKQVIQDALALVLAQLREDPAGAESILSTRKGGIDMELVVALTVTAANLARSLAECDGQQTAEEHLQRVALTVASWPDDQTEEEEPHDA
jgi:hypothetical protein